MLQETQLQIFEDFSLFEQRILCNFLSQEFNDIEHSIAPDIYWPIANDRSAIEYKKKRYEIIQEVKRRLLNIYVDAYEIQNQQCENLYQQEFNKLKQNILTDMNGNQTCLLDSIIIYMNHRRNRIKKEICYKLSLFRRNLLRRRHHSLSSTNKIVSVRPQVILDINHSPMNVDQLEYLSRGRICYLFFYIRYTV